MIVSFKPRADKIVADGWRHSNLFGGCWIR